jgi:PBP1b-binding outer membrane lipoprotein LpoB
MKKKILVVLCAILFLFGCSEKEEVTKNPRRRGKRVEASSKVIELEKRVSELEAQLEILSVEQAKIVKVIDVANGNNYEVAKQITVEHPDTWSDWIRDNPDKDVWVKGFWE